MLSPATSLWGSRGAGSLGTFYMKKRKMHRSGVNKSTGLGSDFPTQWLSREEVDIRLRHPSECNLPAGVWPWPTSPAGGEARGAEAGEAKRLQLQWHIEESPTAEAERLLLEESDVLVRPGEYH
eukprot:gene31628-16387_t